MNTRSRALAWDPTTAIEALAAADAALWIWTPADDQIRFTGATRSLGLGPLAPECSGAAFAALAMPQDRALADRLLKPQAEGTEIAVSVIDLGDGPVAMPAVEIRPSSGVYDYTARYTAGATRFLSPAPLDAEVAAACAEMALVAHRVLGLRDLSRTDMIVRDGVPYFLEVNVAPGMTETSLLPLAIEASSARFADVCAALVQVARERSFGAAEDAPA